jgi:DNA-binding transcriptional ArsR family regulator
MSEAYAIQPEGKYEAEALSDERVGELLVGAANHEVKAIVLGLMEPGEAISPGGLRRRAINAGGLAHSEMVGHSTTRSYCEDSFIPAGLAKSVISANRAYELTEEGATIGRAVAGHALNLSLNAPQDISLRRIFGLSHSRFDDERPAYPRYELLKRLQSGEPFPIVALAGKADTDRYDTTAHRLKVLEDDGLIESQLRGPRGIQYALLSLAGLSKAAARNRRGSVTKDIDASITEVGKIAPETSFGAHEVYDYVTQELGFPATNHTYINVYKRLKRLEDAGVLTAVERETKVEERIVKLKPGVSGVVKEMVDMVDFLRADPETFIKTGNAKADVILSDPASIRHLIDKGLANSPQATSEYAARSQ